MSCLPPSLSPCCLSACWLLSLYVCRILGTPNEEVWPGVTSLQDWNKKFPSGPRCPSPSSFRGSAKWASICWRSGITHRLAHRMLYILFSQTNKHKYFTYRICWHSIRVRGSLRRRPWNTLTSPTWPGRRCSPPGPSIAHFFASRYLLYVVCIVCMIRAKASDCSQYQ
jgi:hypothetical protein